MKTRSVPNPEYHKARFELIVKDLDQKYLDPFLGHPPRFKTREDAMNLVNAIPPFIIIEDGE